MESAFSLDSNGGFEQLFAVSFDYDRFAHDQETGEEMLLGTESEQSLENIQFLPQELDAPNLQTEGQFLGQFPPQPFHIVPLPQELEASDERFINNVANQLLPQQEFEDPARTHAEVAMFRDIKDVKRKIKELKANSSFDPQCEAYLELKLRKTRLYIQKKQFYAFTVGEAPRDKELVHLELGEVCFYRDLRKARNKILPSPVDLDDDEDYVRVCSRRFTLQKELQTIGDSPRVTTPQLVNPTPFVQPAQRYHQQNVDKIGAHAHLPHQANLEPPQATFNDTSAFVPPSQILESSVFKLVSLSSRKRYVSGVPKHMQHVMGTGLEETKKVKRPVYTNEQKANRDEVMREGGQCLSCKFSPSKVQFIASI
jgi:hypothetical protein